MIDLVLFLLSHLSIVPTVLVSIMSTTIVLLLTWRNRKYSHMPPGSKGWPIVGHLFSVRGGGYRDKFAKWRKRYGPIFTFRLGTNNVVVLSDSKGVHEAYMKRGRDLASKPRCPSLAESSNWFRDLRFSPLTDKLLVQRKIAVEAVGACLSSGVIVDSVNESVQITVSEMLKSPGLGIDIHHLMQTTIFDIMHRICFGEGVVRNTPKFNRLLQNLNSLNENFGTHIEDVFPSFLDFWPTPEFRQHRVRSKCIEDYVHVKYRNNKKIMDWSHPTNLSQNVIQAYKDVDFSFEMVDMHMIKIVCDIFYGGVDPIHSSMLWAVYVMCSYPKMQEKIYKEVKRVVGNNRPGREHMAKLVYTQAFIQEVWRLYPFHPLGLPHSALVNTQVMGYTIPKNTMLVVDYHAMHRDPKVFPDPDRFQPERFLSHDGNDVITHPKGYLPFSIGSRCCIGEKMTREQVIYALAGIVSKVKLSFVGDHNVESTKVKGAFLMTPQAYPVMASPRH